MLTTPRVERP